MSLPMIRLRGSTYQQGKQHGEQLKVLIAHNLKLYFDRFEKEGER